METEIARNKWKLGVFLSTRGLMKAKGRNWLTWPCLEETDVRIGEGVIRCAQLKRAFIFIRRGQNHQQLNYCLNGKSGAQLIGSSAVRGWLQDKRHLCHSSVMRGDVFWFDFIKTIPNNKSFSSVTSAKRRMMSTYWTPEHCCKKL